MERSLHNNLAPLTVHGRSSGRFHTTPVTVLERGDQRWVAAIFGEVAPNAASRLAAWFLCHYLGVTPDASLDQFVAAAQRHPVFQLRESSGGAYGDSTHDRRQA
jgi:hypothetical protein